MVPITFVSMRYVPRFLETDIIQAVPKQILDFVKEHRVPLKRHGKAEEAGEPSSGYSLTNPLLSTVTP